MIREQNSERQRRKQTAPYSVLAGQPDVRLSTGCARNTATTGSRSGASKREETGVGGVPRWSQNEEHHIYANG